MHATSTTPAEAPDRRPDAAFKENDMRHSKTADFDAVTEVEPNPLAKVAADVASLAMQLRGINVAKRKDVAFALALPENNIGRVLVEFHQGLHAAVAQPIAEISTTDWFFLCLRAEGVAKKCAREEWSDYAVNPDGLADMVRLVTAVQEAMRTLAHDYAPGAAATAIDAIYFGGYPGGQEALPSNSPDPVLPLLARIEELAVLEDDADGDEATDYGDERDAQEVRASKVQATGLAGAAGQIALAMHQVELIRGCYTQEDRDHHHDHAEGLLRSALVVLADHLSPKMWSAYVGGYHPSEVAAAQAMIDAYESDSGHLCTGVRAGGVHVRIQARPSERASQIEAALKEPGVAHVVESLLWKRTEEASEAVRRGEGVVSSDALTAAWIKSRDKLAAESARAHIDEYRALGGTLAATRQENGRWALFTGYPESHSARADELERELVADGEKSRAVMALLKAEAGPVDEDAIAAARSSQLLAAE